MAEVTSGVKYLKISSLDANGGDCSPKILNADSIRINYPDVGPVQYDILTTQQQSGYFLLGIIPQSTISSLNNIKDYTIGLAKSPASVTLNQTDGVVWIDGDGGGFNVASGNGSSYYNTTTDAYTFNLPNIPTYVTSSITVTSTSGTPATYLSVLIPTSSLPAWNEYPLSAPGVQILNQILITGNGTFNVSSSINDIPGGNYYFGGVLISIVASQITITAAYETISQTTPSSSIVSSLINISPDIINFYSSDDNVLINNAVVPQYSTIYQDIDYSTGLVPTNFNLLVNGNANYAPIQDSNYTATGWANSRYKGSRVSSPDFNVTT